MMGECSYMKNLSKAFRSVVFVLVSIALAFSCGFLQGCAKSSSELKGDALLAKTSGETKNNVSLEVSCLGEKPVSSLDIAISGKTEDGEEFNKTEVVVVGLPQRIDLEPGVYTFSFEEFTSADGKQVYKAASASCTFDGKSDEVVKLSIVLDEEKTAEIAAADEAAKAAAEVEAAAAAQRAAEEKAAAEAAAAAQAQAAARQSQSSSGGGTVYVAASGNGSKYHSSPSCSRMKGTITMSVSQAQAAGYTPCSKCY